MKIDLNKLRFLLSRRSAEIEKSVRDTGYLAKTVIGVGTFLLDNEGNFDLLTDKQQATFERFIKPLLAAPPALNTSTASRAAAGFKQTDTLSSACGTGARSKSRRG